MTTTISPVAANKQNLLNKLPGLQPGGTTTIGGSLVPARDQFPNSGGVPRAILLLTDGMENTPPMIAGVTGLNGIDITAIGFGTESNLDGQKLTDLAQTHNGIYKRAGTGLDLRKFFALAFGEIFEAGALVDPEYRLGTEQPKSKPMPFDVCGEEAVTVVVGWDTTLNKLGIQITTPSGQQVNLSTIGIEVVYGDRWMFARVPLPHAGERDGTWHVGVHRLPGGGEFPPPPVDLTYFATVVARGGPTLKPCGRRRRRLYTGDTVNPRVILQYRDETVPLGGSVELTVRRQHASVGTVLSNAGLGSARTVDGDVIPARQASLLAIEQSTGQPVAAYVEETHQLDTRSDHTGLFRPAGVYGTVLADALVVEGNYTFHARARYGVDCTATCEVQWTEHVTVGIDPSATTVTVEPGPGPGGSTVAFTPRDRYGNHLGPGASDGFTVSVLPGCRAVGDLVDHRDGRYSQRVECDDPDGDPEIVVTQPGRDPVVLRPSRPPHRRERYAYAVQVLCGTQHDDGCDCATVGAGRYATAITLVNPTDHDVPVIEEVRADNVLGRCRRPLAAGDRRPGEGPHGVAAALGHDRRLLQPRGHAARRDPGRHAAAHARRGNVPQSGGAPGHRRVHVRNAERRNDVARHRNSPARDRPAASGIVAAEAPRPTPLDRLD